jgi:hypothetical protein
MIFDGDCAFCTTSANFMRGRIRPRCDIEPWQRTDIETFGLTATECTTAVQFVGGSPRLLRQPRGDADAACSSPALGRTGCHR